MKSRRSRWGRRYTAQSPHIRNMKMVECKLIDTFGTAMCEFAVSVIIFSTRSTEPNVRSVWAAVAERFQSQSRRVTKCVGTRPQNSAKACRKFYQD